MSRITRRALLTGVAGMAAYGGLTRASSATGGLVTNVSARAADISGTTLAQFATPAGASGYRRLTAGPGIAQVVRTDLCAAGAARDDARTAVGSIAQITDIHLVDSQSPVRFEFLTTNGSAFRSYETLGTQAAARLLQRINGLARGPMLGRDFDCVVSTGDITDNHETVELDWYFSLMHGGSIVANTGDPKRWESVQTHDDERYYTPESPLQDRYKKIGFPQLPGFFDRVMAPHTSPGLKHRWYSTFGNHDDLIQGNLPSNTAVLAAAYTGPVKLSRLDLNFDPKAPGAWLVTPDQRRKPFSRAEFINRHRADGGDGHGFGLTRGEDQGYYEFQIAGKLWGISLDTTVPTGGDGGSVDQAQWQWLQQTLAAGSSRYYDTGGRPTSHRVDDRLFVIFSHHTRTTMDNLGFGGRHSGDELVALLQRFPNVLAWVNGHTHQNHIWAHRGKTSDQSFWEINTASHIDYPQLGRIIEVADNADGTLSVFATLIEADSPYAASHSDGSQGALASLYRELAFNDLFYSAARMGTPADQNVELLLTNPLRGTSPTPPTSSSSSASSTASGSGSSGPSSSSSSVTGPPIITDGGDRSGANAGVAVAAGGAAVVAGAAIAIGAARSRSGG